MSNLLSYRKLLGNFTSIYELQAIPGWNLDLIRLQPYINIAEKPAVFKSVNPDGAHLNPVVGSPKQSLRIQFNYK